MAINKKLIHFKSRDNFDRDVANENILDTSICFIQDSKEISTHGTIYSTVAWSVLEDPFNGHEYVDLGLSVLWSKSYLQGCYTWNDSVYESNDVASIEFGGKWRMPTYYEITELINQCTWSNFSYGSMRVTGPNGNSIEVNGCQGNDGYYRIWSSELRNSNYAWCIEFNQWGPRLNYIPLDTKCGVKPVINKKYVE